MKAYILTREENQYDQYGAYFVAWFPEKPTANDIREAIKNDDKGETIGYGETISYELCSHILNGGGRREIENTWWNLTLTPSSNSSPSPKDDGAKRSVAVVRDYWNAEMRHRPYQGVLHNAADQQLGSLKIIDELLAGSSAQDGDEIEITIRKTGNRPFGNRRWFLKRPHEYGPETDAELSARTSPRTRPNPGSDAAKEQGCTCPEVDNAGRGDGFSWIERDCPIHGVKSQP